MPGAGTSKQTQNTQQFQQSQNNPWAPTIPTLQNLTTAIAGQLPNASPNGAETAALGQLAANAQNTPNYIPQATSFANSLLNGGGVNGNIGTINNAYSALMGQLSPIANAPLDPTQTPGIQNVLDTIRNDVSNSVNGMFAGAGRDLSGLNQQTLARGIAQGEAVPLLNQYNQNVANVQNAAGTLYNSGLNTANDVQNLAQTGYGNIGNALTSNYVTNAQNAAPTNALAAASAARNLPIQNLAGVLGLTLPIAGLGGQSSGSGTSNTVGTNTASPLTQLAQLGGLFTGGVNSPLAGFGNTISGLGNLLGRIPLPGVG